MSAYYYDCEFLEGTQKENFPISLFRKNTPPTIDLISIGIVAEDGREYYAISKDFNLKEAWNIYDLEQQSGDMRNVFPEGRKIYWIRENVLKSIFEGWCSEYNGKIVRLGLPIPLLDKNKFTYKTFKKLLKVNGKSNKQIVKEIKNFCYLDKETKEGGGQFVSGSFIPNKYPNIELYGYYSAYDHVALCWLFGKMMDLPKGFPMYCKDLKQVLDEKAKIEKEAYNPEIKKHYNFPKQDPSKAHNALEDARWNKQLHEFLNSL